MNKAILNGQIIYASDIMMDYKLENKIRDLSRTGKLMCPDGCCDAPVLKYCHGNKRKHSYFSHRNTSSCDYDKYDKQNTDVIDSIKNKLYEHLIANGVKCEADVKVINRHYAHLAIYEDDMTIAIELVSDSLSKRKTNDLVSLYKNNSVSVIFVVIGSDNQLKEEYEANYVRRFSLNETKNNNLLIISELGNAIYQYRYDKFNYTYLGRNFAPLGNLYFEKANFELLAFVDGCLTIDGFDERYTEWFNEKQKKFDELKTLDMKEKTITNNAAITNKSRVFDSTVDKTSIAVNQLKNEKVDKNIVKTIDELFFIENIPPLNCYFNNKEWSGADFLSYIEKVCHKIDNYTYCFQLLRYKCMHLTEKEKQVIKKLMNDFKVERPDYSYILETAQTKYINLRQRK